ncbi:MAG: cation:proton antiporter [Chloroherpetonaceae bacterium]|nr:cation:proton antiporter [Chloroherpetonaceae bacterium]MDW8437427.1 cation:proton antiporter [Chloroherpetonaceae bacterium]
MHHFDFLGELTLIVAAAIVVILVFQRFKLPSIVGLIFTGILLGQSVFGVVKDLTLIEVLAELGVVLLLFTIGLEFSLDELKRLKEIALIGGTAQIVATIGIAALASLFLFPIFGVGLSWRESVFLGIAIAASSTAICLKLLADRDELSLPHGRIALGILILQDVAIVPMVIAVTFLNPDSSGSLVKILRDLGLLAIFSAAIIVGFQLAMPRLVRILSEIHAKEALALGAILLCFGSAYLTMLAGLSLALGGFIAGVIIASTDESHKIARSVEPLRDALTSIFFVSVGLLLNVNWAHLPLYALIALGVILLKFVIIAAISSLLGYSMRESLMAGLTLAQIGEFSFVLANAGKQNGVIGEELFQAVLATIVITMIVTPLIISLAPRMVERLAPALEFIPLTNRFFQFSFLSPKNAVRAKDEPSSDAKPHVIVIGYGTNGRNVAAVLKATNISYAVIENDRKIAEAAARAGENVVWGDCAEKSKLLKAGVDKAEAVVIGISDHNAVAQCIRAIRELNNETFIIVRTRNVDDVRALYDAGASTVVTEKLETAIQIFSLLLQRFKIDGDLIQQQQELIRRKCYEIFPKARSVQEEPKALEEAKVASEKSSLRS